MSPNSAPAGPAPGAPPGYRERLAPLLPGLVALYRELHAHPELSGQEAATAARMAGEFAAAGCRVTTQVGGHGVVGILANGPGPVLLLRADLDALPIREATGLAHASRVEAPGPEGNPVPVMHACGHDLHAAALAGAARLLGAWREAWRGTLLLVAQPAEEAIGGARLMLADGLYRRFPRPDWALAAHVAPWLPAGSVGLAPGFVTTACQSLDLEVRGRPAHAASPQLGCDAVVLAAQLVLGFQAIVARRVAPGETAAITVGRIQGGTSRNSLADRVLLELSLRGEGPEAMARLAGAVAELAEGQARAVGLPPELWPRLTETGRPTPAVWNHPELVRRLGPAFGRWLGAGRVTENARLAGSEDFSRYAQGEPPVPLALFLLGCTPEETLVRLAGRPEELPRLHTPEFAPAMPGTLLAGLGCLTAAVLELLPPA